MNAIQIESSEIIPCPLPSNKKFKNLTGKTLGRLTVISYAGKRGKANATSWFCRCVCGPIIIVTGGSLSDGGTKSCGCLSRETQLMTHLTHGMRHTPEYQAWNHMRERCLNPNDKGWRRYGGRGISVCERWLKFDNFFADVGLRPSSEHSLDRFPNRNGNYEPGNVRWATRVQQSRNRDYCRLISFGNKTMCLNEWDDFLGFRTETVSNRLQKGWSIERALTTPMRWRKVSAMNPVTLPVVEPPKPDETKP